VTSPRLIDGLWRVYFPGGHVYRYQLRKAPEGGGHPGAESLPSLVGLERGTVNGWIPAGGDRVRAAILERHGWGE
jgi:hypothetical protein